MYQEVGESRVRYAQPDGLLFDPRLEKIVIVEVKLKHTEKSWWQMRHKYRPIVEHVYPWAEVCYCTVVQWFDVATPYPENVHLRPAVRMARPDEVQVTIWKP